MCTSHSDREQLWLQYQQGTSIVSVCCIPSTRALATCTLWQVLQILKLAICPTLEQVLCGIKSLQAKESQGKTKKIRVWLPLTPEIMQKLWNPENLYDNIMH